MTKIINGALGLEKREQDIWTARLARFGEKQIVPASLISDPSTE